MQVPEESHYYFTSESVTEGHPDKICDIISDSILDACLAQDPNSKVAMETVAKSNKIILAGELTTSAKLDVEKIVRDKKLPDNVIIATVDDDKKDTILAYVPSGKTDVHIIDKAVTRTEKDIKDISEMGFDHVRVPVDYIVLEDDDGNWRENGSSRLKSSSW